MSTLYRNKAQIIRTREEWLAKGEDFYRDLGLPVPSNLWDKLVKVIKLVPEEGIEIDQGLLEYPEANPNMVREMGAL